jgi:hypothetical protein
LRFLTASWCLLLLGCSCFWFVFRSQGWHRRGRVGGCPWGCWRRRCRVLATSPKARQLSGNRPSLKVLATTGTVWLTVHGPSPKACRCCWRWQVWHCCVNGSRMLPRNPLYCSHNLVNAVCVTGLTLHSVRGLALNRGHVAESDNARTLAKSFRLHFNQHNDTRQPRLTRGRVHHYGFQVCRQTSAT